MSADVGFVEIRFANVSETPTYNPWVPRSSRGMTEQVKPGHDGILVRGMTAQRVTTKKRDASPVILAEARTQL
jgi:hypothetical protein